MLDINERIINHVFVIFLHQEFELIAVKFFLLQQVLREHEHGHSDASIVNNSFRVLFVFYKMLC